jgi:hypothetical protein
MNYFKGLIKCNVCGKNYGYRLDHLIPIYTCSGKKNYGMSFCNNANVKEKDLLYVIENHCKLHNKIYEQTHERVEELVDKITVGISNVEIHYKDGMISIFNSNNMIL